MANERHAADDRLKPTPQEEERSQNTKATGNEGRGNLIVTCWAREEYRRIQDNRATRRLGVASLRQTSFRPACVTIIPLRFHWAFVLILIFQKFPKIKRFDFRRKAKFWVRWFQLSSRTFLCVFFILASLFIVLSQFPAPDFSRNVRKLLSNEVDASAVVPFPDSFLGEGQPEDKKLC